MRPMIGLTARVVCSLAICGSVAVAQDADKDDHAFGRLSPQRPVVEIPADQQGGVDASNAELPPPADWEIRDPNFVVEPERPTPEPPVVAEPKPAVKPKPEVKPEPGVKPDAVGDLLAEELDAAAARLGAGNGDKPVPVDPALASRTLGAPAIEGEPLPAETERTSIFGDNAMIQTALALAGVVALILVIAWVYERSTRARRGLSAPARGGRARSPAGLIEVLARYPMGPRQSLVLLKFDRRVLLLNQTAPRGGPLVTTTLCELTDAEDVASVLVKVRDADGESIDRAFRDAMERADRTTGVALGEGMPAEPAMDARFEMPVEPKPAPRAVAAPAFEIDYDPEDLRRTVGGSEADRNQLWEELGTDRGPRDPIGSLRRRLEAMRGGTGG